MKTYNEDYIERTLICSNPSCEDKEIEGQYYHDRRHKTEFYTFNPDNETFHCNACNSIANETFDYTNDEGETIELELKWVNKADIKGVIG